MTWRAHIESTDILRRYVKVAVFDEHADGSYTFLTLPTDVMQAVHVNSGEAAPDDVNLPTFPAAALPALLGALSRHLGAVEHPEQLRRDYDDERKRVDLMIKALIGREP